MSEEKLTLEERATKFYEGTPDSGDRGLIDWMADFARSERNFVIEKAARIAESHQSDSIQAKLTAEEIRQLAE